MEFWYYPKYKKTEKQPFDISSKAETDEITVMSANVRCISPTDIGKKSWCYRAGLIIENVASVMPDVIGFQEVTKFHYAYLQDTLKGYDSVIEYRDNTYLSEGCPIFYSTEKFELAAMLYLKKNRQVKILLCLTLTLTISATRRA